MINGRSRAILILTVMLAGCGSTGSPPRPRDQPARQRAHVLAIIRTNSAPAGHGRPEALVTAETENRMLVVDLRSGQVRKQIALAADPENVAADVRVAVVVSPNAGTVTVLDRGSLRALRVLGDFGSPHIPTISPDGAYAHITDDARGTLTTIRLSDATITSETRVGRRPHHLTSSPDGRQLWIALGESANTIAILDTSHHNRPRVIGRFHPGFPAHDLSFTPDGQRVWITSANGSNVEAFSSREHRLLFRVPVGPPPQHLAFDGPYAYLTSGYGNTIEKVALNNGRVLKRTSAPHGSFELDAADGYIATSSLLLGTLAIYNPQLDLLHTLRLAPTTRDLAITP